MKKRGREAVGKNRRRKEKGRVVNVGMSNLEKISKKRRTRIDVSYKI